MEEIFANFPNRHRYNLCAEKTVEWVSPLIEPRVGKSRYKKKKNGDKKAA